MMLSLILFLAVYLPFQVALNPAPGVDAASIRVIILVIFLVWLAKGLKDRKIRISSSLQTALVSSFLFFNFLSIFFARNPDWGIRKLVFLFSIFPIYFVVSDVVTNGVSFKKVSIGLVASGALAAILGIAQFFAQFFLGIDKLSLIWSKYVAAIFFGKTLAQSVAVHPSWLVDISGHTYFRAISIFPDPHMFALFLGLLLPLAIALFFEHRKNVWLICSGAIFIADLLTFSRGGYLGLIGGAIVTLFIFQNKLIRKYKLVFFLGIVSLMLVIIIPGPVSQRFFSSFNLEEGSNAGRLVMWQKALENISMHPFLGTGIGNFPLAVDPLTTYREPIYAHNTYLDIAVEAGIFAGAAWVGLLFFSIKELLKKARKSWLYLGTAMGLIIFSIHSIVETGIYSPVVLTLVLMFIAFSNIQEIYAKTD